MNYNIYFSPTGGTKKVTSLVSEQFSPVKDIDLSLIEDFSQYEFNQDDFLYCWGTFIWRTCSCNCD